VSNTAVDDKAVKSVLAEVSESKPIGQRLEPSRAHPFPARMPLPLTEHLIQRLTSDRAVVVDPMVGSGTTAIAAKRLGRTCIGIDRDPLAVLVARTAIHTYSRRQLEEARDVILDDARAHARSSQGRKRLSIAHLKALPTEDREFIEYWFPAECQDQLVALVRSIGDCPFSQPVKDFASLTVSSLIIAKSAGASYALDIARSRPHKVEDKPISQPFDAWTKRFDAALSRHLFFEAGGGVGDVSIRTGDARRLRLKPDSVDLVLCSPPYLNAIDYLRAHKFSLIWMGHELDTLRDLRGTMIGTERGLAELDGLPDAVERRLSRRPEARRRAQIRRYLSDLGKAVACMARMLKPNGLVVLVVGPTMINRLKSDASDLLAAIGDQHGLRFIDAGVRHINSVRRSLPAPNGMGGTNPLGARMRREVIVALRKD
jgi:DNA modification methylase